MKFLYTAADFELDERDVIKNEMEKLQLDRLRVRQNVFLVIIIIKQENNEWRVVMS